MPSSTDTTAKPLTQVGLPFNLLAWIEEHKEDLKPPVSNKQFYTESKDVIVFVAGGPNTRNDYHVNTTEELFYQLKGDIAVGIREPDGSNLREIVIKEGEMFLLPRHMPHQPRQPADTIGLIIEFPRGELDDALRWYCPKCDELVHEVKWRLKKIDEDLGRIMKAFWGGPEDDRTCKNCGEIITKAT